MKDRGVTLSYKESIEAKSVFAYLVAVSSRIVLVTPQIQNANVAMLNTKAK
jgi:hypothetical protein